MLFHNFSFSSLARRRLLLKHMEVHIKIYYMMESHSHFPDGSLRCEILRALSLSSSLPLPRIHAFFRLFVFSDRAGFPFPALEWCVRICFCRNALQFGPDRGHRYHRPHTITVHLIFHNVYFGTVSRCRSGNVAAADRRKWLDTRRTIIE